MISKVASRLILFQSIQCASFSFLRLRKEKIILHCLFAHLPLGRSESESQIWFIIWLISQLEIQCCLTFSWEMLLCLQVQSLTGVIFTLDSQHSKWKISSVPFPCSYTAASIHLVCDPFFQVNNVLFGCHQRVIMMLGDVFPRIWDQGKLMHLQSHRKGYSLTLNLFFLILSWIAIKNCPMTFYQFLNYPMKVSQDSH